MSTKPQPVQPPQPANYEELARACELIADETLLMSDRAKHTLRLAAKAVRDLGPRLERIELGLRAARVVPDPWGKEWRP